MSGHKSIKSHSHVDSTSQASKSERNEDTPLMKQFWRLKDESEDCLLLFRMGDFYELFGEDAVVAARVLEITLTSRDKNKPNPIPMAGVPHHSASSYIQRLLDAGHKVAIAEQMQDPTETKGLVEREIVRVFTPAIQFEQQQNAPTYLACWVANDRAGAIAYLDASTGECRLADDLETSQVQAALSHEQVKQVLFLGNEAIPEGWDSSNDGHGEVLAENFMPQTSVVAELEAAFAGASPSQGWDEEALRALATAVKYVRKTQRRDKLEYLQFPRPLFQTEALRFGPRTADHLDLFPTPSRTPNVFDLINHTQCALGARRLRQWLEAPLSRVSAIQDRASVVRELLPVQKDLHRSIAEVYDLERILGRVGTGLANPKDILALGKSLGSLPALFHHLEKIEEPNERTRELTTSAKTLSMSLGALADEIRAQFDEDAPLHTRDGKIFRQGTDSELDRLIGLTLNGDQFLIELEARERQATGIPNLKVKYNRVFGYFIEVSKAHLKKVPEHYQRKQSMVNAERYFTDELKSFEEEILSAKTKRIALEQEIFGQWVDRVAADSAEIQKAAHLIADIDALASMSVLSLKPGWNFPSLDESKDLSLIAGRHPLVEASLGGEFVPNDLELEFEQRRTLLITGPNMGGKSTIMRQCALIVVLGQMGCPVPAAEASWGVFESLFTRIGAHDSIATGQSTFMVEMNELAQILSSANERSLVILDEVGRGTSTFDGMSVAWAAVEHLCTQLKSRTLFATHYHELTELGGALPGLGNVHMSVEENGKKRQLKSLRFLYRLSEGPSNESYGIQVAELAGVPAIVVRRAWERLRYLEAKSPGAVTKADTDQLSLFTLTPNTLDPATDKETPQGLATGLRMEFPSWTKELDDLDLESVTPIQALNLLHEWKNQSQ
jgi:DNA mismatch repair protein MutS